MKATPNDLIGLTTLNKHFPTRQTPCPRQNSPVIDWDSGAVTMKAASEPPISIIGARAFLHAARQEHHLFGTLQLTAQGHRLAAAIAG
jgi:hypothetical protein